MPMYRFPELSKLLEIPDTEVFIEDLDLTTLIAPHRALFQGLTHSEETKTVLREQKLGSKNPFFGKKHTDETKERVRKKAIGRPHHTEEHKQKLSNKNSGSGNPMFGKIPWNKGRKTKP